MKSERRHELKENDLAHALESIKHYLDVNGRRVGMIVLGCAAITIAVSLTVQAGTASMEDRWQKKSKLQYNTPDEGKHSLATLETLIAGSSDEQFNLAALLDQGMHGLRLAQEVELPPDRDLNDTAGRAFNMLLKQFGHNKLAVGAAHAGLATVAENSYVLEGDSKLKTEARRHLKAIVDDPAMATLPFQKIARDRLATLDKTFSPVRFVAAPKAPAAEPAPSPLAPTQLDAEQPETITISPEPISVDEVPKEIIELMKSKAKTDKTDAPSD